MRYLIRKTFIFIAFALLPLHAAGQEGHPNCWWQCKNADFIVEGELTYDSSKYYEVSPIGMEQKIGKYYLLVGTISISKVLYINTNSQYLESYQQYLKHKDQKYPVLINAVKVVLSDASPSDKPSFHPLLYDIPTAPSIFALSQVFLLPFHELKLEDGVPTESIKEAMKLIDARPNNLVRQ